MGSPVIDRYPPAEADRAWRVLGKHWSVSLFGQIQGRDCPHFWPVLAKGVRLPIPQQVIATEGDRVEAHLTGHQVQHRLHGEGELRSARRPRVASRYLVRVDPLGHHPHGRDVVAAGCPSAKVDGWT